MRKVDAEDILGVSAEAGAAEIRKCYKQLALKTHPDKNQDDPDAKMKFQRVSEAYKCLTDPNYVDDEEAEVDLSEEEMFNMFNSMFHEMFDQMSEEFGAMADMEGIPAPPPAFLRAFMQKEMMHSMARGGHGDDSDDDRSGDEEDSYGLDDMPPEMLAALMAEMNGGVGGSGMGGFDPNDLASMLAAMGMGGGVGGMGEMGGGAESSPGGKKKKKNRKKKKKKKSHGGGGGAASAASESPGAASDAGAAARAAKEEEEAEAALLRDTMSGQKLPGEHKGSSKKGGQFGGRSASEMEEMKAMEMLMGGKGAGKGGGKGGRQRRPHVGGKQGGKGSHRGFDGSYDDDEDDEEAEMLMRMMMGGGMPGGFGGKGKGHKYGGGGDSARRGKGGGGFGGKGKGKGKGGDGGDLVAMMMAAMGQDFEDDDDDDDEFDDEDMLAAMAGLGGRQQQRRGGSGKGPSSGRFSGKGQHRAQHGDGHEDNEWEDMSSSDDDGLPEDFEDFEDFEEDMQDKIAETMAALNAFRNMTTEEGFDIGRLKNRGGASGGGGGKNKSNSGSGSSGSGGASKPLEVGDDVVVVPTGTKGTVRFMGPVHYAKGEFVGVELSKPQGKNDGAVKGHRYFQTAPNCGAMLRPQDVQRARR